MNKSLQGMLDTKKINELFTLQIPFPFDIVHSVNTDNIL